MNALSESDAYSSKPLVFTGLGFDSILGISQHDRTESEVENQTAIGFDSVRTSRDVSFNTMLDIVDYLIVIMLGYVSVGTATLQIAIEDHFHS